MSDLTTTTTYYQDLLLYQYQSLSKARATVGSLAESALCDLVVLDIGNAFNIDLAVGEQLDWIGRYVGFSRRVKGELVRDWFVAPDYTTYNPATTYTGMTDYTDTTANSDSVTYRYLFAQGSFSDLTDEEYRYMLKLKVALNNSNNTLSYIQNILYEFFDTDILCFDSRDMFISYLVGPSIGYFTELAISQDLLPKPMGVENGGVYQVTDPTKVFGMQDYIVDTGNDDGFSDYVGGLNDYQFIDYANKIG